jgi:hypothetical protein
MDKNKKQQAGNNNAQARTTIISLLLRVRCVRKTRFLRFALFKAKALPVERHYASLRKLGMHSWPEYDKQVASKLATLHRLLYT